LREVVRLTYTIVDIYCASYCRPPAAVTQDIDDTVDVLHGHQQLSLFARQAADLRAAGRQTGLERQLMDASDPRPSKT
jgi:hypothetical protein